MMHVISQIAYQYQIKYIHETAMSTQIGVVWLAPFTSSSVLAEVTSPSPLVVCVVEAIKKVTKIQCKKTNSVCFLFK